MRYHDVNRALIYSEAPVDTRRGRPVSSTGLYVNSFLYKVDICSMITGANTFM